MRCETVKVRLVRRLRDDDVMKLVFGTCASAATQACDPVVPPRAHTIIIIGSLAHNSVRNTPAAPLVRGETANVTGSIVDTYSTEQVHCY